MKCLKCGNTTKQIVCPSCGFDLQHDECRVMIQEKSLEDSLSKLAQHNDMIGGNSQGLNYVENMGGFDVGKIQNPLEFFRAVSDACDCIVTQSNAFSKSQDDIERIGCILDGEKGVHIANMLKQGTTAYVEEGLLTETYSENYNGIHFDRGLVSPYFATTDDSSMAVFKKPAILLSSIKINSIQDVLPLIEGLVRNNPNIPLLIVAPDWDDEILATLVLNKQRGTFTSALVKAPGFGDRRNEILIDIATVTGTSVFPTSEYKLGDVTPDMLGRAKEIRITKDETIIAGGYGSDVEIKERLEKISYQYKVSTSDYDKEKLKERFTAISEGVSVLIVGGASGAEIKKKTEEYSKLHEQMQDAIKNGLPSDITSYADSAMIQLNKKIQTASNDEKIGIELVQEILKSIKKQT